MSFGRAALRYAQDDLEGAVEIMRRAMAAADESMGEMDPYRWYMHSVLADWVSELGARVGDQRMLEEARGHIEAAWKFVTTEEVGKVYLKEVTERKGKVEGMMK